MKIYIAVGLGGVIGTILRYLVSNLFWIEQSITFPWATYIVNISGAFLLTFIVFQPFFKTFSPLVFIGFTTGLLGSYTTFSTLILETFSIWSTNATLALLYLCTSIFGGLLASYTGYFIASKCRKCRKGGT